MSFRPWPSDVVPLGWALTTLSDLVVARAGDSKLIKGKLRSSPGEGLYKAFSASGQDVWMDAYEYDVDGLVVSAVGARCGKTFLADGKWTAIANTHVVIPDERAIDRRLLWYAINDEAFWIRSGTAQPFVVVSKSLARTFGIAPRAEQTRIVEKLEELLSDLDAGMAELKAAQKKLQQYRQSLLKAAVDGSLTAAWREAHPAPEETGAALLERILRERRARWEAQQLAKFEAQGKAPTTGWQSKYPQPIAPNTGTTTLPKGWTWATLDQLTDFITSGSRGWAEYYSETGATFIRSQDINTDCLDVTDCAYVQPPGGSEGQRTRVELDDLLLTITGANVGKAARVHLRLQEAYVSQHVALLRPVESWMSQYLHLFLTANGGGRGQLSKAAYGAGKPGLNLGQVGGVAVPLPPAKEVTELMAAVSTAMSALSHQESAISATLRQSTAQRQNLLRAAFAGQLVPQDPADEPAAVLLARIRAERAAQGRPPKARKARPNPEPA